MSDASEELIYRIRPGANFGRILQEVSCLQWFSTAEYLNDPFDGISQFEASNIDEIHLISSTHAPGLPGKIPVRLTGEKKWMVSCYSTDWKSAPMWAHYGSGGTGYCLGYSKQTVIERVSQHQAIPGMGTRERPIHGSVDYVKKLPPENSPVERRILSKIRSWEYENEWRIAALGVERKNMKGGMHINLRGALKQVLVGWNVGAENYTPLLDLVNKLRVRGEDVRLGIVRIDNPKRDLKIDWPWEKLLEPVGDK